MKAKTSILATLILFKISLISAQIPNIVWEKCYGGTGNDEGYEFIYGLNGDILICGGTSSVSGNIVAPYGTEDALMVSIDSTGIFNSYVVFGGWDAETMFSFIQGLDSSFIIAGTAGLNNGHVSGCNHPSGNFWILKINQSGVLIWQRCLGGSGNDEANEIIETTDHKYIVTGETKSYDYDVVGMHGQTDMWVVKMDTAGNVIWTQALGGTFYEVGNSCLQNSAGNYVIAGCASSNDGNVFGGVHNNSTDVWVVELDTTGYIVRQKCFGGSGIDNAFRVLQAPNNGLYIAATTSSSDGDVTGNNGGTEDFWLIHTDSLLNIIWEKCYGGLSVERVTSACLAPDGGVVVIGHAGQDNGQVTGNHGGPWPYYADYWVVKTDSLGNFEWGKCLGGSAEDIAYDIKPTSDGGYIVVGTTISNDGDVTGNQGMKDIWVVKLSNPTAGIPVPESGIMELKVYGQNDKVIVQFFSKHNMKADLKLFDSNGRLIAEKKISINEGINYHETLCSYLSQGIYFVELTGKNFQLRRKLGVLE